MVARCGNSHPYDARSTCRVARHVEADSIGISGRGSKGLDNTTRRILSIQVEASLP